MKTTRQGFGDRVAELRKQAELTQAELADELSARLDKDVSALTVTRIEAGSRPTSVDELIALGEVFRVLPEALLPSRPIASAFKMCSELLNTKYRQIETLQHQLNDILEDIEFAKAATDNVHVLRSYQVSGEATGVRSALQDLVTLASHPRQPDLPVAQMLNELKSGLPQELKDLVTDEDPQIEGRASFDAYADSLGRVIEGIDAASS